MNIVYISNEKYVPHLAASMCSVMENNESEKEIVFYVVSTGMTEDSTNKLAKLCDHYDRRMLTYDLSDLDKKISPEGQPFLKKFDISILGRFFLGEIMPANIDKVLYLDCDTIITGSLHELYDILPKEDIILAAVQEPTIYKSTKRIIALKDSDPYFNSGVLLIDMNMWRRLNIDIRLRNYFESISKESIFADQDAINGLLCGYIESVHPKYNFFTNYKYFRWSTLAGMSPAYKTVSKDEFDEAKASPVVIHYAGDERPWIRGSRNPYRKEYNKYLSLTEWRDTGKETGKESLMVMYHLMNISTLICPPLRKAVSEAYAGKLMRTSEKKKA